jgi:hypothetical protein
VLAEGMQLGEQLNMEKLLTFRAGIKMSTARRTEALPAE